MRPWESWHWEEAAQFSVKCGCWVTLCKPQLWVTVTKSLVTTLSWGSSQFVSQARGWSGSPSPVLQVDTEKWDDSCRAHMETKCSPFTEFLQSSGCVGDGGHQKGSSWCLQEWPLFQADGSSEDCDIFAVKGQDGNSCSWHIGHSELQPVTSCTLSQCGRGRKHMITCFDILSSHPTLSQPHTERLFLHLLQ